MADEAIQEIKTTSMEDYCVQKIEEALADSTPGRMEQVMFYACHLHTHYTRRYRKHLEEAQRSLLDQWSDIIQEQRGTYNKPTQTAGKYGIAGIQLFAAALPFAGGNLGQAAGGISGFGGALSGVSNNYDEKIKGEQTLLQHKAEMKRRLLDQTNQSGNKGFDSIDAINRLAIECLRSEHQAKIQMLRG